MAKKFRKITTTDLELSRVQDNIGEVIDPLTRNPLTDAVLLEDIEVVLGANTISHKLKNEIRGYIVVKNSADATFYDSKSNFPKRSFILTASAAATISLLVF